MLRSLAATLARHVFRVYAGLVCIVTLVQAVSLYQVGQDAARSRLEGLARALAPAASEALRSAHVEPLQALARDALQDERVAGVRIRDSADAVVAQAFRSDTKRSHQDSSIHRELFASTPDSRREAVGRLELQLDDAVVRAGFYRSLLHLLGGDLIMAAGLLAVLLYATRDLVTRPLNDLHQRLQANQVDSLAPPPQHRSTEFAELHDAVSVLSQRLTDKHTTEHTAEPVADAFADQARFLANASHDLRQPLHALGLYLGAIDRSELPARAAGLIDKAGQCAQVVEGMFRSILDISQLDAGAARPELRSFPVQQILDAVRVQFEPLARSKNLTLRVVDSRLVTRSDPVLLGRVIHNLVSNAVRYTAHGRVLVGCRRHGASLRIEVHDTGPGIADSLRRAIFTEYQQGGPGRSDAEGVGLGLAIAQRLSRQLSHPLVLRSTVARGTVFSLRVPRVGEGNGEPPITADSDEIAWPADLLASRIVMIVDDDPAILDASASLIEKWRGIPATASNHAEAMDMLATPGFVPDVLICDLQLPDGDGNHLIQHVRRASGRIIPALLITGTQLPEGTAGLVAHVLYKPVAEETLYKALTVLLARDTPPVTDWHTHADRDISG